MPWISFGSQDLEQIQNHGRCNVRPQHVISLRFAVYRLYKLINILKESTYYENNYVQHSIQVLNTIGFNLGMMKL